jgi:ribose 1,5-bisphosphokinase PhnN
MNKKKPAIVIRRILDSRGRHSSTEIDLRNERLAEVMREIYSGVEGMEISRGNPSVSVQRHKHDERQSPV